VALKTITLPCVVKCFTVINRNEATWLLTYVKYVNFQFKKKKKKMKLNISLKFQKIL
jgi:hypothetical protein